jgi:hypothetical protein
MPGHDVAIELQDLRLERTQLRAKGGNTLACDLWHACVIGISDDIEQLFDTVSANRRDDAELGKVGADRIDHCSLLAHEEMARAMEHEAALLLGRLRLHKAHARSHDGFADGLGVGSVVLLTFEVGLHVGGGINRTLWPSTLETNRRDRWHPRGHLNSNHVLGTQVPVEEPSTASEAAVSRCNEVRVAQRQLLNHLGYGEQCRRSGQAARISVSLETGCPTRQKGACINLNAHPYKFASCWTRIQVDR